jgi:hypothetical protein
MNEAINETYRNYLKQLKDIDLSKRMKKLGLEMSDDGLMLSFFGTPFRVSPTGVFLEDGARAGFAESVVFFKYILMCPGDMPNDGVWAAYHSFKDAQPLLHYFAREVTKPIETFFSGKMGNLEAAGKKLGGTLVADKAAFDFSMEFKALPRIPLFLRFNDADEEFPAQCTVLFKSSVERYLDMESLGILGAIFSKRLTTG